MKNIIISMCLLVLLAGCSNGVKKAQWVNAEDACNNNEGVMRVSNTLDRTFVYCNNGAEFNFPQDLNKAK